MLAKTFAVMCILSFVCALITGRTDALTPAIFAGTSRALDISASLVGMTCLWCGIMNILKKTGAIEMLARLISPVLRLLFPTACKTGNGIYECAASISANLLGIGNAATPFALSALKEMQKDNDGAEKASDDMIMLTLISASPISIMPMTVITLRNSAGSVSPTKILVPVWICSVCGFIITVILVRTLAGICRGKRKHK
ncbi:MAG: hypothetical protein J6V93_04430 [Clostridia bacterium]|nr:hypothetical protein [Clostridia bacterium]